MDEAARARMASLSETLGFLVGPTAARDLTAFVTAFDGLAAAERERDAARSSLEEHRIAYTAVSAERDELQREMDQGCAGMLLVAHALGVYSEMGKGPWPPWEVLRQRATRLAALEDAARAWDASCRNPAWRCPRCVRVHDAVVALAAPPGESP